MTILTADKNKDMAKLLAMMVEKINPKVEIKSFQTGEDVVSAFMETEEVTLVILGYRLFGGKTGAETALELQQKGYNGLIFALSNGCESDWAEVKVFDNTNFHFFHKCTPDDMKRLGVKLAIYTAPTSF